MPERGLGGEFERHNVLALGVVLVSDARPLEPSRARELFDGASSPRPPRAPSLIVIGRSTQRVSDTDRVYGNGHSVLYSTGAASFQPEQGEYRGSHGLVLQSLDTNASAINGRYAVWWPSVCTAKG